jgi:hypothetical protein
MHWTDLAIAAALAFAIGWPLCAVITDAARRWRL